MFVNDVDSSWIEWVILIYGLVFEITMTNMHLWHAKFFIYLFIYLL